MASVEHRRRARRCCKSENARLSGWVYVDVRGRDLASVVTDMQGGGRERGRPAARRTRCRWSGQFEYLERATERLQVVVPFTLAIIFVLLYLLFRRFGEAALIMATLPFALIGGFWLVWSARPHHLGRHRRRLHRAGRRRGGVRRRHADLPEARLADASPPENRRTEETLLDAIREGAVLRVRPKANTARKP